ncbi:MULTISPECIES: hypothetical protein [unclassified Lysobacter]|uniref:hypothetical protein n=1 Tax=unclassified Lysobacter TaxID=2635362 RepID=UPI001BE865E3|nr:MULTISPECIES: hypothetical protein [unclassified Lysobacter]MBT2746426.1 hypothetical protein [Lysobacter sp. ISL-42]MBT2753217.1 hypothetical protein [Lysobacter sp. ISL-50]MBT2776608.1 hypothetical protein [Lysobacter sp. ISL-54]MBT2783325.1 hypothetical protein [Lysobacter sp. ISL-52]
MPDRNPNPPRTWTEAFAQLPAETPPADGWARMAATLAARQGAPAHMPPSPAARIDPSPRRRSAAHPARRWAIAAMLAAALPLGLWLSLRAQRPTLEIQSPGPIAHEAAARDGGPAAPGIRPGGDAVPVGPAHADTQRSDSLAVQPNPATPLHIEPADAGPKRAAPKAAVVASTQRPSSTRAAATRATPSRADTPASERIAATANATPALSGGDTDPAKAATLVADASGGQRDTAVAAQLRELQTESAQLEALVTLTRDDRVASATAALMSSDLDQRLSLIDTALTDAALPAEQRLALWRQRVGALRSLAGVESTQRWFAARGERYDDALVRVD